MSQREFGADVSVAAKIDMGLQQEPLDLTALEVLLLLDEVERRGLGGGRGEPVLKIMKGLGCGVHVFTVVLPSADC